MLASVSVCLTPLPAHLVAAWHEVGLADQHSQLSLELGLLAVAYRPYAVAAEARAKLQSLGC